MTKALVIFLVLSFYSSFAGAQSLPGAPQPYPQIRILKVKQPLILIGALETNYHSLIIDRNNLEIIKSYKDSLELIPFGEKGQGGIILARLKTNTPLLRLAEVLDYYEVPAADRSLKVLVNQTPVHPDLFLADVKRIKAIEKTKQDLTSVMRYSFNPDEEYLNIVTVKE